MSMLLLLVQDHKASLCHVDNLQNDPSLDSVCGCMLVIGGRLVCDSRTGGHCCEVQLRIWQVSVSPGSSNGC